MNCRGWGTMKIRVGGTNKRNEENIHQFQNRAKRGSYAQEREGKISFIIQYHVIPFSQTWENSAYKQTVSKG